MEKGKLQLKLLGFIGIFKESIKIILSNPKLFIKITLTLNLPFSFFLLAYLEISMFSITKNLNYLSFPSKDPISLSSNSNSNSNLLFIFQAVCIVFSSNFSLLYISVVVYTVTCIHTNNEVTYKKAILVAHKVKKRLLVTMMSRLLLTYVVTFVVIFTCLGIVYDFSFKPIDIKINAITFLTIIIMIISLFAGVIYMGVSWQLANVITVLENYYGFKALRKSRQLIKGNIGTSIAMTLVNFLFSTPFFVLAQHLIRNYNYAEIGPEIIYGVLFLVVNPLVMLYGLVVQTVFYFVCKSSHDESIDELSLIDYFDEVSKSNGDHVILQSETVKLDV